MRVLVADDEGVIADTLTAIFRASGFDARAVYSGERAVELAEYFLPDVVICDVMMRGMTGIEVGIHVRRNFPACKVLLFSGQATTTTSDMLAAASHSGYHFDILTKPVQPQVLLEYLFSCQQKGSDGTASAQCDESLGNPSLPKAK